jgi:hypothetical protein
LENQTLYAELLEQLRALDAIRSIGFLEGSFVQKIVKGEPYIYFQRYDASGAKRQLYVGRKTDSLNELIAKYQQEKQEFAPDLSGIERLCAQLRVGGALMTDHASARVVKQLAESGVFRLGGVLVGTHAYIAIGNNLGVRWEHAGIRTRDIDIASRRTAELELILPRIEVDIPSVLESLKMGFFPIPQLDHSHPSTSFMIRGNKMRIDFLTEQHGQETKPVYIPRFKTAAQPLLFMDFLLEEKIPSVVVDGGGVLVNVPSPARFAIHKMIIAQERTAENHVKRDKDFQQAYQVLSVLQDERPGDITLAIENAIKRGRGWENRIYTGIKELNKRFGFLLTQR